MWFFCETSLPFCFILPGSKSSLVYIFSQIPMQFLWSHFPPRHCAGIHILSSMPPTQLLMHFCWGSSIPFTLGNGCISCYATWVAWVYFRKPVYTHATHMAFLLGYHPGYFRKQVCILLCQPHNLCQRDLSGQYSTLHQINLSLVNNR